MSNIDYEELLTSPLDEIESEPSRDWGSTISGVVSGLGLGLLLVVIFGGGGTDDSETVAASPTTTTAAPAVASTAADYPEGFVELTDGIAAHADTIVVTEDQVVVGFATAVKRGGDPTSARWPVGGTWWLETESGAGAESVRVVVGRFGPAAFSVAFPADGFSDSAEMARVRLIERWDQDVYAGTTSTDFTGEPFTLDQPIVIPVNQEVALVIKSLSLGRFLGSVEWSVTGATNGALADIGVTLLDADGVEVGSYSGFGLLRDPGIGAVKEIRWQEPFPSDQEGAVTVVIEYEVSLPVPTPVEVEFSLTEVPVGR